MFERYSVGDYILDVAEVKHRVLGGWLIQQMGTLGFIRSLSKTCDDSPHVMYEKVLYTAKLMGVERAFIYVTPIHFKIINRNKNKVVIDGAIKEAVKYDILGGGFELHDMIQVELNLKRFHYEKEEAVSKKTNTVQGGEQALRGMEQ